MGVHQEFGFVIRKFYPKQQKACILLSDQGKISLSIKDQSLCHRLRPGMLVSCIFLIEKNGSQLLSSIEILDFFKCSVVEEVQWVHLVLELIYFFSPLNNPCPDIFLFLFQYFKLFNFIKHNNKEKNAFFAAGFAKLLSLLDFQPTATIRHSIIFFDYLVSNYIDIDELQNIKSISGCLQVISESLFQEICDWGLVCIKSHPQFVSFKTVDILR